jgi:uncharacterized protein
METSTAVSTRSNLQVVQQGFNDFLSGNTGAIIDICADDVVWGGYKVPDVAFTGMFYGKEGVEQFYALLAESIKYSAFEAKEFITQDENVIVLGHQSGTVVTTGKTFDHDWCIAIKMRNGKVQRLFTFVDSRELAQVFK